MTKHSLRSSMMAAALALGLATAIGPVQAQTSEQQAVVAACTGAVASGAVCQAAIRQYFAALQASGVAGVALQQAVADLVVALADSAPSAPAGVQAVVAGALETIAANYAAPGQAVQIRAVAQQISTGAAPKDIVIPVAASPA